MLKWIVVVLLVVVAGVVALTLGTRSGGSGIEGEGGAASPGSEERASSELVGLAAGDSRAELPLGQVNGKQPGRTAILGGAANQADAQGNSGLLTVEALHPKTRAPLVDLDVWLLDRDTRPAVEWQPAFRVESARLTYLREHGKRFTTDEAGQVEVPRPESGAVLAEGEGLLGELSWTGPIEGPLLLKMRPLVDLTVRVVDDAGSLVSNVPVAIVEDRGASAVRMVKSTGSNGEAYFTYLGKTLSNQAGGPGYVVTLNFPQTNPQRLPLIPDALPSEAVELRMPPAAPMEVQVRGADGELMGGNVSVALGRRSSEIARGREGFVSQLQQRARSGRTRFSWVEVGAQFDLLLSGSGTQADSIFQVTGPPRAQELFVLELVWDAQHPTIVGRAIDPEGQPLAGRRGTMELRQDQRRVNSSAFLCDEGGHFSLSIESAWRQGSNRAAIIKVGQTDELGPLQAQVDLSFVVPPGTYDLGDVRFAGLPLLASGVVVDAQGELVGNAHVVAQYQKSATEVAGWQNLEGASDTTGDDGRFQVYGASPVARLAIRVRRRGLEGGGVEFQAGAENLVIPMTEGGGLEDEKAIAEKEGK